MLTSLAYRTGHDMTLPSALPINPRAIYHHLNPHPALAPIPTKDVPDSIEEQAKNEADYRQLLAQGALAVLLPTEDLENACLRTLVADVIAEPILGNSIGGRVCEGWFICASITRFLEVVQAKMKPKATGTEIEVNTRSRLEKFGLLAETEQTRGDIDRKRSTFSSAFWLILQYIYLGCVSTRFIILGLFAARSQPSRSSTRSKVSKSANVSAKSVFQPEFKPRPILCFRIFPLISSIVDIPHRMPWLYGTLALIQHHLTRGALGVVGGTDGILDQ